MVGDITRVLPKRINNARVTGAIGRLGAISLGTYPIAFGSGAILGWMTGIDFHLADTIITVTAGPIVFCAVPLLHTPLINRGREDFRIQRAVKA